MRLIVNYSGFSPQIADDVYLAPGSHIIGRVSIGKGSSVWFNTVVRGDIDEIIIGKYVNIQDNSVIHVDNGCPTNIGEYVVVGHNAVLHGCTIGNGTLIGMGAIVLNGAQVGENALVAAGSIVREGGIIPAGALAVGSPARVIRKLKSEEIARIRDGAEIYYKLAREMEPIS